MQESNISENLFSSVQVQRLKAMLQVVDVQAKRGYFAKEAWGGNSARSEILFKSIVVFIEKGLNDATVQDILEEANVSRRTFYKYFKNKMEVLKSIYDISVDVMNLRFQAEYAKVSTMQEFVDTSVDLFFSYHQDFGPMLRIMQEEAYSSESPLSAIRKNAFEQLVKILCDAVERIQKTKFDSSTMYPLIWIVESATLHLLQLQKNQQNSEGETEKFRKSLKNIIASALIIDKKERPMPACVETEVVKQSPLECATVTDL